jgi:hypothetical protein
VISDSTCGALNVGSIGSVRVWAPTLTPASSSAEISSGDQWPTLQLVALWTYSSNALAQASGSLVDHGRLITKVYYPL